MHGDEYGRVASPVTCDGAMLGSEMSSVLVLMVQLVLGYFR